MDTTKICFAYFLFTFAYCYDIESLESNGIEESPIYETIIFSDIADIFNDLENNNQNIEKTTNESESNEDIEDLLSEYHHYLEKAHKQRVNYLEKSKLKNKVPVIRHEKFSKLKSFPAGYHKDQYKKTYFNSDKRWPEALNPFNMFLPFTTNKFMSTTEQPVVYNDDFDTFNVAMARDTQLSPFPGFSVKSSCNNCKNSKGSCKQCLVQNPSSSMFLPLKETPLKSYPISDLTDDTLNIRIKVELQIPKVQTPLTTYENKEKNIDYDNGSSKEYVSAINLPSPYFNFPIPMNLFGYKRILQANKNDYLVPLNKLTMHKKKKSKIGSGAKKHRKKMITFHNIKVQPQSMQAQIGIFNLSDQIKTNNETVFSGETLSQTNFSQKRNESTPFPLNKTNLLDNNKTEENIIFIVNITNNIDNGTDKHASDKTENSIETEYKNEKLNTSDKQLHLIKKRDAQLHQNSTSTTKKQFIKKRKNLTKAEDNSTITISKNPNKRSDRILPPDTELLFWPNSTSNANKDHLRNITAIILESEHKREKLNMSTDTLRHNHTRVLEQVIFGTNVDWNDVDSVAPAFISFFGKYIEGVMTFCSDSICHSMKCTKKNCINRVCSPRGRFNSKGHCAGSNNTDSAASLESIMDIPSNIAFEIIDILKDRMVGKLYGKITICINSKCITFATSKKLYLKNKCNKKELTPNGHCGNSKEAKIT